MPAIALLLLLTGCANDDADLVLLPPMPGTEVSLQDDVQPIFNTNCAFIGCHAGSPLASDMSLEEGKTFDPVVGIVNVPSVQAATLFRVKPGSAIESYLINKLEGTQGNVGGGLDQMPQGGIPLGEGTIQVIRDWIDQGAQDN